MRKYCSFDVKDDLIFKQKLVHFCKRVKYAALYDSNNYYSQYNESKVDYHTYDYLAGIDSISIVSGNLFSLEKRKLEIKDWLFGYLGYELKNDLEKLYSVNNDELNFSKLCFFQPRYIIAQTQGKWTIGFCDKFDEENTVLNFVKEVESQMLHLNDTFFEVNFESRVSKEKYVQSVGAVLEHIHKGDVYELNYCIEFFSNDLKIDPYSVYNKLVHISPTPFASFIKLDNKYVLSASPERYIKKEGSKLICQPIKGTASRGQNKKEDDNFKRELRESVKEMSENIMIADLVRNDLSRVAARGSVDVEEMCGIYPFSMVFQMITTVVAQLDEGKTDMDAIKTSFPMGSMTGAPKIRAMKLIEKYEETKRGVYSGAIGYFSPEGNFDFNVVIRSLLYNSVNNYLSFMVGSAITEKSIPEQEYDECMLKAKAIFKLFNQTTSKNA